MGKTFNKVVACSTDDHPAPRNEHIKKWIENNGGRFTRELDTDVTHLICSKKAWQRYHDIGKGSEALSFTLGTDTKALLVRQARRRRIKIVTFQWLEDSLMRKDRRPLPTLSSNYNWEQRSILKKQTRLQLVDSRNDETSNKVQKVAPQTKALDTEDGKADKVKEFGKESTRSVGVAGVLTS